MPTIEWYFRDVDSGPRIVQLYQVADDGDSNIAAFLPEQTQYTLANLPLEQGKAYQFYLVAYDNAGNTTRQEFNFYYREATPRLAVNTTQLSGMISPTGQNYGLTLSLMNVGTGKVAWEVARLEGSYFQVSALQGEVSQSSPLTLYIGDVFGALPTRDETGYIILRESNNPKNCTVKVNLAIRVIKKTQIPTYLPIVMGGIPTQAHFVTCTESPQTFRTQLLISGTLSSSQEWYRTPLTFTFVTTPPVSVTTFYRFTTLQMVTNRQAINWLQYSQPFTFSLEGNRAIHYYSEDNFGNVEPVQTATFKIDLTTPIVEIDAERLSRCDTALGYTIRDLVSGLHDVVVTVDGVPVDEDFNLMYLELGDHTVAITGTDYADWVTTFVQHIPLPADVAGIICTKHILFDLGEIFGPGAQGIVNSLDAKLESAQNSIERGQIHTAINQLEAFIHEVEAQQANHIKLAGAERMIADARTIIAILQAGN